MNIKNADATATITFLKKVKSGEYSKCEHKENLKPLRAPVYRNDTELEKQYYYSMR